jgi:hypothetical protein
MDCIPIIQFAALKGANLEPPPSSKPILTNSYELHPCFTTKVQEQSFLGKNMTTHMLMQEFEQVCSSLHILSMSHETLKWKLFPFYLMGLDKLWYTQTVESAQREWEVLRAKFCLAFFAIP